MALQPDQSGSWTWATGVPHRLEPELVEMAEKISAVLLFSGSTEEKASGLAAGFSAPGQHRWSLFCLCVRELTEIKHVLLTSVHPVTGTI